jgi:hypothetical protein
MLDAYKAYLIARVESAKPDWIPATVLIREIREVRQSILDPRRR